MVQRPLAAAIARDPGNFFDSSDGSGLSWLEVLVKGPAKEVPKTWFALAVCAVLCGNTLISLGLLLQKRSHHLKKTQEIERECCGKQVSAYIFSPAWLLGLGTFLAGHCFCFLGLAVGTSMVMSCLNCWCIVVTILLGPRLFRETVSLFKVLAVAFLISGCIWVTFTGPKRYEEFTVERLQWNVMDGAFLAICVVTVIAALLIMVTPRRSATGKASVFRFTMGAAICAWYSVLAAKCFSSLHFTTLQHGKNQLIYWQTWAVGAMFVGAAAANLHLLNLALAAGDAVVVMPAYESMSLAGQIVVGGLFFQEFHALDMKGHLLFWTGVALVVVGVAMVSRPDPDIPLLKHVVLGQPAGADGKLADDDPVEDDEEDVADARAEDLSRTEPRQRPSAAVAKDD